LNGQKRKKRKQRIESLKKLQASNEDDHLNFLASGRGMKTDGPRIETQPVRQGLNRSRAEAKSGFKKKTGLATNKEHISSYKLQHLTG
jgi:hypothetical protein